MCILIVKPAGAKVPRLNTLRNCAKRNNHGFGFATSSKVFKSLSFDDFVAQVRKIKQDEPAIIHFRFATHGSICEENCHPFKDDSTGVAFAHNGVLPIEAENNMTDSETAFRRRFVPKIKKYGLYSISLAQSVNRIIGASKFAFIDSDGNLKTFGWFIEHDGCYFSNYQFMS